MLEKIKQAYTESRRTAPPPIPGNEHVTMIDIEGRMNECIPVGKRLNHLTKALQCNGLVDTPSPHL